MPIYKMDGKRDGKNKYRVRINYIDATGKARQVDRVTYGSDEAKILELKLLQEIRHEAPAKRITLRELFDEYCEVRKNEIRESTLDKFKRIMEYHIMPELENIKLDKLAPQLLAQWKLNMENKGLSLYTKQAAFSVFRNLLNYAVKMDYISKNPLVRVGNFRNSGEIKKEMDFYTADEFKKFISVARQNAQEAEKRGFRSEWDYYVFFAIAFYTGLRKGEIHGLQWNDISKDYLSVKRSVTQKLKGEDRETPPKNTASVRTLQVPIPLKEILSEHKKRWKHYEGFSSSFKVCGGIKCLRDTSIENHNKKFALLAGVKKIRIHDFRHSHVSLLANNGINIQEIARRLGHSKIEMTWNTYSHLYPKEEEKAVEILNKII
ncbi:tyrosine-type recombinase/integrase [Christensenella hongkongensis]|uniref:Integrase n=1 Tax=Christensenella hongkongensis TaxID=270498 RepID=A0A0M2NIM3_9FIRM|nr:site-specific integrase [Christensenella hongkongensis]KKI52003.1 Integrase [Christensenella hongkongensis]TCW24802.1 site-specific recombinase XerC [Christensenella hongkongensis]